MQRPAGEWTWRDALHRSMAGIVALVLVLMISPRLKGQQESSSVDGAPASQSVAEPSAGQAELLSDIRQLTFAGRRAGEGYFSADGRYLVFQSEREPDNPFFQIYLMDRETGDVRRISPGVGKTTCAWIHPSNQKILYASTQFDPQAVEKQRAEIEFRKSGQQRRYSWDYDPMFDLVEYDLTADRYTRLTTEMGYDAEGSYSPDGQWICFASNRRGYTGELQGEEAELFADDPAVAMELYLMRSDGTQVQRLTAAIGYDGGPFFSPDGQQICWRRFSKNGATAEIMLMDRDGSNQRALTHLGAMSWAPFFHPSGDYLIFATNIHGFANFELYLVRADGQGDPVRVTYREGFDGLPAFSPDGTLLVWTSNAAGGQSQLFEARWNDAAARRLLGLETDGQDADLARRAAVETAPDFSPADIGRHVDFLCRPELGGRLTGTLGERKATAYVAAYLESLGLLPAGPEGSFFHEFEFISDVKLGPHNSLRVGEREYQVNRDWRPVFFSREGHIDPTPVVCAGYGIVAPAGEDQDEYDSYVHLDVKDKWVMVFRGMPGDIAPERRQFLARYSGQRYKAMVARDRGAKGVIFVSGPTSQFRSELIPLAMDGTLGGSSIAVISVADAVAEVLVRGSGRTLREIQTEFDDGQPHMGFALPDVTVSVDIDIDPVTSRGRNVLARLPAGDAAAPPREMVVVGAHIDHLGQGAGGGSLAREEERGGIHRGADDNASG
ncbi:MAG: M28 family peptidase, partial [Planctomycetota bacterium]